MTTDVTNVQQAFQMSIRICVRAPIMLVSAMVMTFLIHPRFALIFLAVILCLAVVLALISSKANPTLRKVFHEYDELYESGAHAVVYRLANTSPIGACISRSAKESLGVGALLITTSLSPLK